MTDRPGTIITVTLNPAFDRIIQVPDFRIGAHAKGRLLTRVPAGKGVNVSRGLDRLGLASIATGFVGRESMEAYERSFDGSGVQSQFLAVEGATRENITVLDPVGRVETHIRDRGITPTDADWERLRHKINLLAKPGSLVIFSGSIPPDTPVGVVEALIELAASNDCRVAVDGPGELLAAVRGRKLWLIKPNRRELAEMCPEEPAPRTGARPDEWSDERVMAYGVALSRHVRTLIVSSGSAGGFLFVDEAVFIGQVDIEPRHVVSTVGCGDSMLAAFVAAQCRGDDIKTSYRYALAVATAAALNPIPGAFDLDTVNELHKRVSVEPAGS